MAIYMKLGNIKGDATQQGFEGWINIESFDWSLARVFAKNQTGRAANREGAQAEMKEITVTKDVDHSSGEILKLASTGFKGERCEIVFLRTGNPGEPYLKFTLTDTLLKELDVFSLTSERPVEKMTLNFTELEIEVKVIDEANVSEDTMRISYNAATGQGG